MLSIPAAPIGHFSATLSRENEAGARVLRRLQRTFKKSITAPSGSSSSKSENKLMAGTRRRSVVPRQRPMNDSPDAPGACVGAWGSRSDEQPSMA